MLKPLLLMPSKVQQQKHHAALPYIEIKAFFSELQKRAGIAARALEFSILTVSRSGKVRGAESPEIDLKTIPASRMKAGKEHRVPLSDSAIALLKDLHASKTIILYYLPPRGGQLSDISLLVVLKRMGHSGLTVQHFVIGLVKPQTINVMVIEHKLANQLANKAEAAYQWGTLWPKRVALMDDWTEYCVRSST